jgi:hypothetical protein
MMAEGDILAPPPEELPVLTLDNRDGIWPVVLTYVIAIGTAWLVFALALWRESGRNPFLGWENPSSRVMTGLGVCWAALVIFFVWAKRSEHVPAEILVREDSVQYVRTRRQAAYLGPGLHTMPFKTVIGVRWYIFGPSLLSGGGGTIWHPKPGGGAILLSVRNCRIVRDRWEEWKRRQDLSPLADLPPVP